MPGKPSRKIIPEGIIAIIFTVLYLLLPTKMYYIDGVFYAEHLENIPFYVNGFHPHHLLYLPLMHFLYAILHSIIPALKGMTFLLIFSAICGGITLYLFSLFLKKLDFSAFSRITGMILLGTSYTFWHHSTDANIYIPAHMLTLIVILLVYSDNFLKSPSKQILTGLLLAFAGLIHQMSLFVILPLAWLIFMRSPERKLQSVMRFVLSTLLVLIITYPTIFVIYHGDTPATAGNFLRFTGAFARASHYFSFNAEHAGNFIDTTSRGHTNALFALKSLERVLYDKSTGDTLTSNRMYRFIHFLTLISVGIFMLIIFYMKDEKQKTAGKFILFLFLVYYMLTAVFMPENHFYRIFYLPALITIWIMLAASLPGTYRSVLKPLVIIFLLAFIGYNFMRGIYPETMAWNNPYLRLTKNIDKLATSKDVVIFSNRERYFTGIYRYFGKGDALHMQKGEHFLERDLMFEEIDKYENETVKMLKKRYRKIYLTREASESSAPASEGVVIGPVVFTPNNYRLPHPKFMIVRPNRFKFVKWHTVDDMSPTSSEQFYMEVKIE